VPLRQRGSEGVSAKHVGEVERADVTVVAALEPLIDRRIVADTVLDQAVGPIDERSDDGRGVVRFVGRRQPAGVADPPEEALAGLLAKPACLNHRVDSVAGRWRWRVLVAADDGEIVDGGEVDVEPGEVNQLQGAALNPT